MAMVYHRHRQCNALSGVSQLGDPIRSDPLLGAPIVNDLSMARD